MASKPTVSPMELMQKILADASIWCCTCTTRDLTTITRRFEHEGISFLTITLPTFGSDFERSLDLGYVAHDAFLAFKKRGGFPDLFRGFLERVFDRRSGLLLNEPCHTSIFFLRQLTLMWKKIYLKCSDERERKAFDAYVQCENEVREWSASVDPLHLERFGRNADLLWGPDCSIIDRMVYDGNIRPKHGPGKTADRTTGNGKYDHGTWHARLEGYFPSGDFRIANYSFSDVLNAVDFVEPDAEMPVKVVSVPKTLKTPRIIAIEPTCVQYTQQALMEAIVVQLEKSNYLQGAVGFTDQTPNQEYARAGSLDGSLATIDLSEASDRVSNLLVQRMLRPYPHLSGAVQASRSLRANVPGHGVLSLTKFASMGSATCFPIEAMVFLTIVLCGYEQKLNRPLTRKDVHNLLGKVRVYGDDIVIPVNLVRFVVADLNLYGFKINTKKSFWTGRFRESCGKDYYGGDDVTVTYLRRLFPSQRTDVQEMISMFSFRNQLYKAGLWKTVEFLDIHLRRLAPLPTVLETSPVLGRISYLGYETQRMCPTLHRPLVRGYVQKSVLPKSKISGHGALLKFFLKRGDEPIFDPKHLERQGRPEAVDIKLRWGPPY